MAEQADGITQEVFDHLVDLAELELGREEKEYLLKELNSQLNAVRQLAAVRLDEDIGPASHGVPYTERRKPELREDKWEPFADSRKIIDQAPETEEGYIAVPDIPHTELK